MSCQIIKCNRKTENLNHLDNKLMIIKYAICRQQYNSFKKDISELEGDDFKVVKYLGLNPTFLAYYTIELILLYKGKKVLKDYLKKKRYVCK